MVNSEHYGTAKTTCQCTLAQRVTGDGCEICNPELAAELYEENDCDE